MAAWRFPVEMPWTSVRVVHWKAQLAYGCNNAHLRSCERAHIEYDIRIQLFGGMRNAISEH